MKKDIALKCNRKIAYDSPDHTTPWGTKRDNSINKFFNEKLYKLYSNLEQLKILDLGCSGGGFVRACQNDGCLAIGLEGSDFSKKNKRAEWAIIPDFLFTCDITKNFDIYYKNKRLKFNCITTWEVMEHIKEEDIIGVSNNVKKHISKDGLWIMSISPNEEIINGIKLHQTVHNKEWRIKKFKSLGWIHQEKYVNYFNTQFVRGPKYGASGSFHLILSLKNSKLPKIPKENFKQRILDRYRGSRIQKLLKLIVIGEF